MKKTPNRRQFLQLGLSVGWCLAVPPVLKQTFRRKRALKLKLGAVHGLLGAPALREGIDHFAALVATRSNGEVQIEVSPENRLNFTEVQSFVTAGKVDLAVQSPILHQSNHPAKVYFGALPLGLSPEKKIEWLTARETSELWSELYRQEGLKPLFFGCGGSSFGQVCSRKIDGLADLRNLTVCSRDLRAEWYRAAGLVPIGFKNADEMIAALRSGTLALSEPLQHFANYENGLHRLGYYYENDWLRSTYTYELLFSDASWNRFPRSVRELLEKAAAEAGIETHRKIAARETLALQKIAPETGAIHHFPDEVIRHFESHSRRLRGTIAGADSISRQIHESYSRFEMKNA